MFSSPIKSLRAQGFTSIADGPRRRGPHGNGHLFYARWAKRYADVVFNTKTTRPIQALLSQELAEGNELITSDNIRDIVKEARRRGLLTKPPKGARAGGRLTAEARRILAADEASAAPKPRRTKGAAHGNTK